MTTAAGSRDPGRVRRDAARAPVAARGSSCRRTTRPRTCRASPRRSWRPLPEATLLVVDDGSPDGTGRLADGLAAADARVRVRHRPAKQGLGRAYLDGFGIALAGGADDRRPDGRRLVARPGGPAGA